MALRRSKTQQTEDAIMRGVVEIEAFQHLVCVAKDPIDDKKQCSADVLLITISMTGKDEIACGGYCISHLFMLEPYVALAKKNIGLEDDDEG